MPIHDAAYNGSPCALQVLASSVISLAKFAALESMITWRRRASAARGIVRRLTITTSVHELAASKARTSPDPTCPVPPTTKTRKPMLCLSPSHIAGGIFKCDSVAVDYPDRSQLKDRSKRRSYASTSHHWRTMASANCYCFGGGPKSSGGSSTCGTSILILFRSTLTGLSSRPVTVIGNAITSTTMITCNPTQGRAPQ
jgi:hypothetical protein